MFRVRIGLSTGLQSVVCVLTATLVLTAANPALARRHHRHGPASSNGYNPPFASIVVDVNSGKVLQESSSDGLRHPASLTKIMTLYMLFERLDAGKLKLDTPLKVSEHASSQAPSKLGLKPGDTIEVEDAIRAVVTKSANDIAVVIAEALAGDEEEFAKQMTSKAHALGMSHTEYRNASGLPDDNQITTARDLAVLARAIQDRFPTYYRYFATPSFTFHGDTIRNHNHLLGNVEGVDGIKTGYTQASGFNLVTSMKRGTRRVVAVVLGGRTAGARDAQMRELLDQQIAHASDRRTAPLVAENAPSNDPRAKASGFALASVASPPSARAEPAMTAAARAAQGSSDPIKPIMVKTIPVKAGSTRTASLDPAPAQTSLPAVEPAKPQILAIRPDPDPQTPIINPQPGVLGVLPAQLAAQPPTMAVQPVIGPPPATALQANNRQNAAPPSFTASTASSPIAQTVVAVAREISPVTPAKADPAPRPAQTRAGWMIQVGALEGEGEAKARLDLAQSKARETLGHAEAFTETFVKGDKTFYRARFAGFDKEQAEAACKSLKRSEIPCMALKN